MLQFIPGTDFIFSGYSAIPKRDNLFGGGNFDAEDFDDYNVLQRDMQIDGGVRPIREADALTIRRRAAQAIQATYRELGFPPISDAMFRLIIEKSLLGELRHPTLPPLDHECDDP